MRMKTQSALLLAMLVSIGCNSGARLENEIGRQLKSRCHSAQCVVRISELTPFDWDAMLYFSYGVQSSERLEAAGVKVSTPDLERQLVFLKNGKVVRDELLLTGIENPVEGEVQIEVPTKGWVKCDRQSEFGVKELEAGRGTHFFVLTPTRQDNCR
jgi:hypothetical protein